MKPLHRAVIAFSLAGLAGALYGVNEWGLNLKRQATERWLQKASDETQRTTDTSLYWLSLAHTQLRGLAALFYGSEQVSKDEFLNALDLIEGMEVESVTPMATFAYVEVQTPDSAATGEIVPNSRLPVTFSSTARGLLAEGTDVASLLHVRAAIMDSMNHPGQVVQGASFTEKEGRVFVIFSMAAPNEGKPGALLSLISLNDFVADLDSLLIPQGVGLRIVEQSGRQSGTDKTIVGARSTPVEAVATLYFPSQRGHVHWNYYWDIFPGYLGGPDKKPGIMMQWGGAR